MKITSIFLSSESDSSLPLVEFCRQHNIHLTRKSLITFQTVDFSIPSEWEVVFFSSPRSFDFFVKKGIDLGAKSIACIGLETKSYIEQKGYSVDFAGENAGSPKEVAADFKKWLGDRIAVFPQSTVSNKSIESGIRESQRIPVIVYETLQQSVPVAPSSVYIFTSPSNAASFLEKNTFEKGPLVIAWGEATAQFIVNQSHTCDFTLKTSTYSELLQILQELIP